MTKVMWTPSDAMQADCAMARFALSVGLDAADYDALHRWSISHPGEFWSALWDFAEIRGERGARAFVDGGADWMTGATFFPDAQVNMAENILRHTGDGLAVIGCDEGGQSETMTHDVLRSEVARIARGLRSAGIEKGDRVGVILPNRIECLVTLLATLSLGAVWTSCSPDFGTQAILDRIGQVAPRILIAAPQFRYGGKLVDISDRIGHIAARIPSVSQLIVVGSGRVEATVPVTQWPDFGSTGPLVFTRVGFSDPCYILYTSGTTGAPKAIVHRSGGVLMQTIKEHLLHGDLRPGDRFLWYTNTAWMMYHWVTTSLACGAVLVLYDGAPILKTADGLDCSPLWVVVERQKLTHLGISPKYLATVQDESYVPSENHDLSSLRWLMSAGSPVAPYQYDWMYEAVKSDMGFASISGGTEVMGCFLLGSPLHPVRRGMLTVKGLGMAVNVLDERGAPVVNRPGDLVVTEPFPSMPLTFWGDGGQARYHDTYFADRTEVWTHGDLAQMNADGSAVILGRSDCTLNPGGVRIGTADIYNVCERFAPISDCIAFGRAIPGDEEIVLCLKMQDGHSLDAAIASEMRRTIRAQCSPRHVPAAIYAVSDIPYTLNGKRVEGAARSVVAGTEVRNIASLANPECLTQYAALSLEGAL